MNAVNPCCANKIDAELNNLFAPSRITQIDISEG